MTKINALIDEYFSNPETQFNPKPLFKYLHHTWNTCLRENNLQNYLSHHRLLEVYLTIETLLQQELTQLDLDSAIQICNSYISNLSKRVMLGLENQVEKIFHILNSYIEIIGNYRAYITTLQEHPVFTDDYRHAIILPGNYCFIISSQFKDQITPNPNIERTSRHLVQRHQKIYYFEFNDPIKPSAEILGKYIVETLEPKANLFPTKSPCIILSVDQSNSSSPTYTIKLMQLSLEVPGVTLETLLLAHDAFSQICVNPIRNTRHNIIQELTHIIHTPPTSEEIANNALFAGLPKRFQTECDWESILNTLESKHTKSFEIYLALRILKIIRDRPDPPNLDAWILKVIPYLNALTHLLQYYGLKMANRDFRHLIRDALDNIHSDHIHLLGLSCYIHFAHDAVGSNIIVDLSQKPYSLSYIDADLCMIHAMIERKFFQTYNHYAKVHTIFANLNQFHKNPLSPHILANFACASAEELIVGSLNAAREYEKWYSKFLYLFPISIETRKNLYIPLKIPAALIESAYRICKKMIIMAQPEITPIKLLRRSVPNIARVCRIAYKNTGKTPSLWRNEFFNDCPSLEVLFKANKRKVKHSLEIGRDASLSEDYYSLSANLLNFLFSHIDYQDLTPEKHESLCKLIWDTLVKDAVMNRKEFTSIQDKEPRRLSPCSPSFSDDPDNSPNDSSTSSQPIALRSSHSGLSKLSGIFSRPVRSNPSPEPQIFVNLLDPESSSTVPSSSLSDESNPPTIPAPVTLSASVPGLSRIGSIFKRQDRLVKSAENQASNSTQLERAQSQPNFSFSTTKSK